MENTEPVLSLEAANDIMANPANPQYARWQAGDREIGAKIEGAYEPVAQIPCNKIRTA